MNPDLFELTSWPPIHAIPPAGRPFLCMCIFHGTCRARGWPAQGLKDLPPSGSEISSAGNSAELVATRAGHAAAAPLCGRRRSWWQRPYTPWRIAPKRGAALAAANRAAGTHFAASQISRHVATARRLGMMRYTVGLIATFLASVSAVARKPQ